MEFISSKDGVPIACWCSGSGASEPLLLVHGTSGDHFAWTPVLAALEQQFCVWTIDRRGRGRSGDLDDYALERESEDIAAVIDAIGCPVHLLGHSFGGLCALEAALLTPNISSLILYEPSISLAGSGWSSEFDAHLQALLDSGNREEALLFFFREIVKSPPHELAALQAGPSWPGRLAAAHTILRELREHRSLHLRSAAGLLRSKFLPCFSLAARARSAATLLPRCCIGPCLAARLRFSRDNSTAR